ncbi:hypothetical protein C8R46DRAFT_1270569 [Mycena filopes]|nr:hypothetical protein C8R46DRAFT_1270569 [Mycena filopes]
MDVDCCGCCLVCTCCFGLISAVFNALPCFTKCCKCCGKDRSYDDDEDNAELEADAMTFPGANAQFTPDGERLHPHNFAYPPSQQMAVPQNPGNEGGGGSDAGSRHENDVSGGGREVERVLSPPPDYSSALRDGGWRSRGAAGEAPRVDEGAGVGYTVSPFEPDA